MDARHGVAFHRKWFVLRRVGFLRGVREFLRSRRRHARAPDAAAAVAALQVAAVALRDKPGILRFGFRTSPEAAWQWLEPDVEGAEWFAGSLATSAEEARQYLRMASPRTSRIPDVVGLDGEAAIEHLAQTGFRARLADGSTSFDRRVVRQDPPANAPVPAERIVVSLYVAT